MYYQSRLYASTLDHLHSNSSYCNEVNQIFFVVKYNFIFRINILDICITVMCLKKNITSNLSLMKRKTICMTLFEVSVMLTSIHTIIPPKSTQSASCSGARCLYNTFYLCPITRLYKIRRYKKSRE